MSRPVDAAGAALLLRDAEDIHILTHTFPDGDTLGCGFGLCRALRALGKRAQVLCADPIPEKYGYMLLPEQNFKPAFLCAVDVADPQLLGSYAPLAASVALAIDHHPSQTGYAGHLLLRSDYGAAAMAVLEVIDALGVPVDADMAACLYTGIATDTGCFKYSNTTPKTHLMAARLMECGAPADAINREMFDMKSRARLEIERQALAGIRFAFGDRCAVMTITRKMISDAGAAEGDLEGLAPLPRQIEGVWVGVTMREKEDGRYKVSLRTGTHVDASKICARLGGGGHVCAAGCTVSGSAQEAVDTVLSAIAAELPEITA
mgnify:FL=1